jgi:predicted DNA binding protein/PAS domain-containing protein
MSQTPLDRSFLEEIVLDQTTGILTVGEQGDIVYANERARGALDCDAGALLGTSVTDVFVDTTLAEIQDVADPKTGAKSLKTAVDRGNGRTDPTVWSVGVSETDGDRFWTLTLDHDSAGRETDIEERLDSQIQQLFDACGEPLALFDPDEATVLTCNREARELFGFQTEASPPRSVREFADAPTVFVSFLQDVCAADEGRREEFTWVSDAERRSVEVVATPLTRSGERLAFARIEDVTDENRLRAQRRRRTAALDAVHDAVALLDTTYEHRYANEAYTRLIGEETDLTGVSLARFLAGEDHLDREIRPAVDRDGQWCGRLRYVTATGPVQVAALFQRLEDGTVVLVVDEQANEGEPFPETATDWESVLEETRERLLAARDSETVATACLDAVTDGYGYDLACFRLETDNELDPVAMTPDAAELVEGNPGFELGRSDAGRAYRTGERVIREPESDTATGDLLSTTLHLPLGDHGVLTVATTNEQAVPPAVADTLTLLAVSAEAVLDRIEREQKRHTQRPPGESKRATLTQETIREIISADSRDEVKQRVCDTLASAEQYSGVWVADLDSSATHLQVSEATGVDQDVHRAIEEPSLSSVSDSPVSAALDTDEITVTSGSALSGATQAVDQGSGDRVVIVPLGNGDRQFGVLGIHISDAADFDLLDKRALSIIGETLNFVLDALENERLLLSDEFVQLEFQVTDPACLSVALSDTLDTTVRMRRTIQKSNDEYLSYVRVDDTSPDVAGEAAMSIDTVQDCRVINDHEYGCLLEVTRTSSGAEVMMEYGATTRRADAESGRGTLVLEAPHTADIREIVQAYQSYNPQSELVTKRRVDRPLRTVDQLRSEIEDELTNKQLSAVSTAYFSGYYEWPRESTAEAVADSIGVSSSTFHQHLRHAHRKLLTAILEPSFTRRLETTHSA